MSTRVQTLRLVSVRAVDAGGRSIEGANVEFYVDGEHAGGVYGSSGTASLDVAPNAGVEVSVTLAVGSRKLQQRKMFPKSGDDAELLLRFPSYRPPNFLPVRAPEARCPDGTSGQPCVECSVAGTTVRICV